VHAMNITLTPEQEKLVTERVLSGHYLHPEHFAAEAFRLLTAREQHEQELAGLRRDIDAGWEDADAGRLLNGPQTMAAFLQRARERMDTSA
jgi:putative addiction module CopG family antidote